MFSVVSGCLLVAVLSCRIARSIPLAYLESKECNHPLVVRGMCAICMASLHEDDVLDGTVHAGFVSSQRELRVDKRVGLYEALSS